MSKSFASLPEAVRKIAVPVFFTQKSKAVDAERVGLSVSVTSTSELPELPSLPEVEARLSERVGVVGAVLLTTKVLSFVPLTVGDVASELPAMSSMLWVFAKLSVTVAFRPARSPPVAVTS